MSKKILFVGDLRTANNYGAIATTDTLICNISNQIDSHKIKYIDYKSLRNPTPKNGWKDSAKTSFKRNLRKCIPYAIYKYYARKDHYHRIDFVPYLFSLYEFFYKRMLEGELLQYEKELIEWADIIYINGEGNIVNGTDRYGKYRIGALYILFMAWVSKVKYNKTVCLVNHTVDPANLDAWEIIKNVYPLLDYIYVREKLSLKKLSQNGVANAKFVPDALFMYEPDNNWHPSRQVSAEIDFSCPYICIGDSSGIKNSYTTVKWNVREVYLKLIHSLQKIIPQIIFIDGYNGGNEDVNYVIKKSGIGSCKLNNCSYHDLYHILSKSELFISGRWHASILATLSGTPILLWGSDSHKTRSLYDLLDYELPFFEINTLPIHIEDICKSTELIIQRRSIIRNEILNHVKVLKERSIQNALLLSNLI